MKDDTPRKILQNLPKKNSVQKYSVFLAPANKKMKDFFLSSFNTLTVRTHKSHINRNIKKSFATISSADLPGLPHCLILLSTILSNIHLFREWIKKCNFVDVFRKANQ